MERFVLSETRRQRQAHLATVIGALVTAVSMVFAVVTYQRSAAEHREAAALGMLQDYLKLAVDHPDLASREPGQPSDARYERFATNAVFTAETLWVLVGHDQRWQRAIDAILREHRGYVVQGVFACKDFTPEFVNYIRVRVPELKCAP